MISNTYVKYVTLSALAVMLSWVSGCSETTSGAKVTGADPGVLEAPIAYVKRPIPVDEDGDFIESDLREPLFFGEGGDVYIRSNSTVTATVTNITSAITGSDPDGKGDVKDLKPNFDGTKLVFSLRLFDPNPNDDDTPKWNLYEYDLTENTLRCLMDSDPSTVECDGFEAEKGDDIAPAYLPDGRIIFSSNRQTTSGQVQTDLNKPRFKALDEDEDEWAMYLHVMDEREDLSTDPIIIKQISYNRSHDLDPTILTNNFSGKILFTRWDNAATDKGMHLYTINPDGTEQEILYGRFSHDTGNNNAGTNDATIQFSQPEEMEDGRIMVIARPNSGTFGGGSIHMIDIENYINIDQTIDPLNTSTEPAQIVATINNVSAANELSLGGRYSAAWPLWDGTNRVLISKSTCEILADDENRPCIEPYLSAATVEEVSPAYAIWLYDLNNDAQKVVVQAEPGFVFTDIVAIQSRAITPSNLADNSALSFDSDMADNEVGAIHIKSVYDFGGGDPDVFTNDEACFLNECGDTLAGVTTVSDLADPGFNTDADQRPARFVRFVTPVALADEDDPDVAPAPELEREAFGPQRNQAMREIIGYAPIEPDGSVKVKVPANMPMSINILDKMGRRIGPRHQNWFHVRPGETMECTGCHAANSQVPHHRKDAEADSINPGVQLNPSSMVVEFPNTLDPNTGLPYAGTMGETMAEIRFASLPTTDQPEVSANIEFEDYWTDPAVRTADTAFNYRYRNLNSVIPASSSCDVDVLDEWDYRCRILINYKEHIHPLWSLPRGVADADTCTNCHTNSDDVLMVDKVPDGQLDLTDGLSDQNNGARLKSYRELFFNDAGQELDMMGALVNITTDIQVPILDANGDPVLDANGDPTFDTVTIDDPAAAVAPSMSGTGARASYFMEKMTGTELDAGRVLDNTTPHAGFMSDDELKLISEWLDIGAQYYNNPFDPQCALDGLC